MAYDPSQTINRPGTTNMQVWRIPIRVKKRFKAACAAKNETIKDVVIELMKEYTKNAGF